MAMNEKNVSVKEMGSVSSESMDSFHSQAHFWGRATLWLLIIACLLPPLYLSFILNHHPGWDAIAAGVVGYAAFIGIMWVLEPITYYPTLGTAGTYMAFLTGNIANMCLPCSAAAQNAIGAEAGSKKAEISGALAIAVASLVNIVVIISVIISGSYIISVLPAPIEGAFEFVLPAIFGGVLGQFAYKTPLYGIIALGVGLAVLFSPIFSLIKIVICVILTITIVLFLENRNDGDKNG
ncbi:small-conductance mechanosensitive channel [Alteribacillus sp. HJP-4]|uniref:small-conductance mechanosensitive channel n=1 Tax=Alteribacillus sp. HJP-4 TaxID=2775394 RepID=UPI0035CCE54A